MTLAAVSGASGFIGTALAPALAAQGIEVRPDARPNGQRLPLCGPALADWLRGADLVYHLAGIAHDKAAQAPEADFTAVNQDLTLDLYRASAAAGVRTFVWLSSIKALGDTAAAPLDVDAPRAPQGPYARSKAQAELGLLRAHQAGGPRLAIVRPPLVYGPGVKGNFARLLKLCASPWPLPLADACGRRALLGLDNLVDLLIHLAHTVNPPLSSTRATRRNGERRTWCVNCAAWRDGPTGSFRFRPARSRRWPDRWAWRRRCRACSTRCGWMPGHPCGR